MSDTEAQLVVRLREGAPSAFAEAFDRFSNRLYRVALGIVHDADEAEDVVQETFITLSSHLDTFEGRSRLGTWLYRVAYNTALQRQRSRGRAAARMQAPGTRGNDSGADATVDLADESPGPVEQVEAAEFADELDEALADLPETLRTTFLLRDIEGLSTAEAAELLEVTPGTLKVRLHRARLSLRERLSAEALPPTTAAAGITCSEATARVSEYLDGELDEKTRKRLEAHVAGCNHCRITLSSTQRVLEVAGARRHVVIPAPRSGELFERLRAVFASRPA